MPAAVACDAAGQARSSASHSGCGRRGSTSRSPLLGSSEECRVGLGWRAGVGGRRRACGGERLSSLCVCRPGPMSVVQSEFDRVWGLDLAVRALHC